MYASLRMVTKYLHYYFTASNGKGHGIHSPFVFEFIKEVLNDRRVYQPYAAIENQRDTLLKDRRELVIRDFGAGSRILGQDRRRVCDIARASLKRPKFAQLLFRMVRYYQPASIIDLGTSLGITTCYLSSAAPSAKLYSFEGSDALTEIASRIFRTLDLRNIELIGGNFEESLAHAIEKLDSIDFAFIDGNHRKEPVLDYYRKIMQKSFGSSIIVIDDIHWSRGMEQAWEEIKTDTDVKMTIDLFFAGIVFRRDEFKVKQHFKIRF
jgi:predicted O-methyltransferase YrrM